MVEKLMECQKLKSLCEESRRLVHRILGVLDMSHFLEVASGLGGVYYLGGYPFEFVGAWEEIYVTYNKYDN
jgi:hypothetical protein